MEDTEQPRSQVRSDLPEVKLPERSRQTLLDEVVGVDRIIRQAARISSKTGKNALDVAMQYSLRRIAPSSKLAGSPVIAVNTLSQPACVSLLLIASSRARLRSYELELRRDSALRLASHENLRMMSLSCSTIVALFHLLSSVLMAMTASSAIVASSNQ